MPFRNKGEMLRALIRREALDVNRTVYVGDRSEDESAAVSNRLRPVLVTWGYSDFDIDAVSPLNLAGDIDELLGKIDE